MTLVPTAARPRPPSPSATPTLMSAHSAATPSYAGNTGPAPHSSSCGNSSAAASSHPATSVQGATWARSSERRQRMSFSSRPPTGSCGEAPANHHPRHAVDFPAWWFEVSGRCLTCLERSRYEEQETGDTHRAHEKRKPCRCDCWTEPRVPLYPRQVGSGRRRWCSARSADQAIPATKRAKMATSSDCTAE